MFSESPGYRQISRRKQAARDQVIQGNGADAPLAEGAQAEQYLRATAPEIVEHISRGEWTASAVLEAYVARATKAQSLTNCLTEVLFAEVRAAARELDEEFASTRQLRGPLHGVPVSFKDQYDVAGADSTVGLSAWADKPAAQDSHVVALVRAAGGIPIAKTNVSQMMFFAECTNPIWGRTLNPHNKLYSSMGSSGGEAALLAMDGAALGWGSDIGGSLRMPATACGIYSLKPGWGRVCMDGIQDPLRGFEGIRSAAGPMGRSVEDLELAARVVFGKQGTDYAPAPLPYRDVVLPEKLKFGYYLSDGYVKPSPANQRAVLETVAALRQAGHECVPLEVPQVVDAIECYMGLVAADGFKTLTADLGRDPVEPGISGTLLGPALPGWVRRTLAWALRKFFGDSVFARVTLATRPCSMPEYTQWVRRRDVYCRKFESEVWDKHGFDGIISPVIALPAMPHDSCKYLAPLAASACLYNVLNAPVGVVPVTHVRASDVATVEWTNLRVGSGHGSPSLERLLYGWRGKGGCYDPEKMAGIPVGVQVVGRKWEEEKVVEMMKVVDHALGPRDFGPFSWHE
ncbi:amidase signature enzyme [Lentinus tigrinus ALCF2SS1-7]|uniref:amidase n=1 Tax=Lentinus tigrinus ALCF2SS1-6 TaxID=1328759 RepID=A0A5C2SKQ9_9APHY|nr:amidase signature enzyme [Lentinus tigrinus ALCF2SS1-6]RPD76593.1 amidase signature enzyme [Lentinus tigrinus ALCF2SS1-7]